MLFGGCGGGGGRKAEVVITCGIAELGPVKTGANRDGTGGSGAGGGRDTMDPVDTVVGPVGQEPEDAALACQLEREMSKHRIVKCGIA